MAQDLSSVTFTPHLFTAPNPIGTPQVEEYVQQHFPQHTFSPLNWLNPDGAPPSIESIRDFIQSTAYAVNAGTVQLVGLAAADAASIPAQNALLKLLEEPPIQYFLFLTAQQRGSLLHTVQSRCLCVELEVTAATAREGDDSTKSDPPLYDQLLSAPAWELISIAGKVADKADALALLGDTLRTIHSRQQAHPTSQQTRHQAILMLAYQQIQANVNSKLALEAAFFQLTSQIETDGVR